ncbi:MAG: quinone-dependent dihydroorotate dehydrogenase [Bdellovibrionales bacterium]|nr:quinone-dependent dihydroorotate dehydrogenase [Bdellovibrionales bacterium]
MLRIIHRFLLLLDPETAHHCGLRLLQLRQWFLFKVQKKKMLLKMGSLHVVGLPRISFKNRLGLAAGFDKNAEVFASLASFGFGFVEIGTVTPKPQPGNPKPRLWRLPGGALRNQLGFNNLGVEAARRNLLRYRAHVWAVPIFANIGKGVNTPLEEALKDYESAALALTDVVDGFVVNLSSPNTPGLRSLQTETFLDALGKIIPKGFPALVKLAPDLEDEESRKLAAQIGESDHLAGLVLTNTSRALAESLDGAATGGVSGRPLFDRALQCVSLARENLKDKTLVGVGGVSCVAQAKAMRDAGADLVEIYTSFVYQGPRLVRELARALT